MDTLILHGGEVKDLGNGKVGGYLVRFGTSVNPDLAGDYFTKDTDFGIQWQPITDGGAGNKTSDVYYAHALDPVIGKKQIADPAPLKMDDIGIWIEAQLSQRDAYMQAIASLASQKKLGWSSGTAAHLVERENVDGAWLIKKWPLGLDASLTPRPCEPQNTVVPMKQFELEVKSLLGDGLDASMTMAALDRMTSRTWGIVHDTLHNDDMDADAKTAYLRGVYGEHADTAIRVIGAIMGGTASETKEQAAEYIKTVILSGPRKSLAGLPLSDELDEVLAAVSAVTARANGVHDLRLAGGRKEGRTLSAAARSKIQSAYDALGDLLAATKPKKEAPTEQELLEVEVEALLTQARANGVAV